jgi:hypothetical protein
MHYEGFSYPPNGIWSPRDSIRGRVPKVVRNPPGENAKDAENAAAARDPAWICEYGGLFVSSRPNCPGIGVRKFPKAFPLASK